ncbi:MAG TPA: ankyrin repeat domain-containing protein [Chthoniobacteraceae bacterium]|nr:ankyrin repeat domain-containing protein [Chthoniobacteraceae bacterium]
MLSSLHGSELHKAAGSGDYARLAQLLRSDRARASQPDAAELTPLHHAVIHRQVQAVSALLAASADVNARDRMGRTPLHHIARSVEESVLAKLHAAEGGRYSEAVAALTAEGGAITPGALFGTLRDDLVSPADSAALMHLFAAASTPEQMQAEVAIARRLLAAGADAKATDSARSTPLHHAAMSPRPELAREFLDAGAKIDALTSGNMTPLHTAALFGGMETAELLLKRGADVNGRAGLLTVTPLFLAVTRETSDLARLLLHSGADVNAVGPRGETPLCRAAQFGATETGRLLLDRGANPRVRFSASNQTPLHAAAGSGATGLVELLLARGADADAVDKAGFTAVSVAAARGEVGSLESLLKAGAKPNTPGALGRTPLWRAAAHGRVEAVKLLLSNGADPSVKSDDGQSPLHIAALNAHPSVVRLLAAHGGVNDPCSLGTPLHCAAYGPSSHVLRAASDSRGSKVARLGLGSDSALCVDLLIEHGASCEKLDAQGRTPLLVAAQHGNAGGLEALLASKAKTDPRDREGLTALHLAAKGPTVADDDSEKPGAIPELAAGGYGPTLKLLLATGADIATRDRAGRTPLHHAVASGNLPALLALMSARSSVFLTDLVGATPLHWAAARGRPEAALALLSAGAPCDASDAERQTPLHMAVASGHRELVEILVEHGANVAARNAKGQTPAYYAEAFKHPELGPLLRPKRADTAGR